MDDRRFDALTRVLGQGGSRRTLLKGLLGLGGVTAAGAVLHDTEAARRGYSGPPTPGSSPTIAPRPTQPPRPTEPAPLPTGTTAPSCPGSQTPCGADCCCPAGNTKCGADCCSDGVASCCDNACCFGLCYGEELCCPYPREFCAAIGACCDEGQTCGDAGCVQAPGPCAGVGAACSSGDDCCAPNVCADGACVAACPPGYRLCDGVCYPGGCCTVADCGLLCQVCGTDHVCRSCEEVGQTCQNGTCVPTMTPSSTSISTNTPTSSPTSTSTPTHSPTLTNTPTPTPCRQNGVGACTANGQCCSGLCQAGLCVATIAGTCSTGFDLCSGGISNVPCGGSCLCGTLSNGSLICFASGACFDNCEECGGATCDPNMPCCAAGCFEPCPPDGTPS